MESSKAAKAFASQLPRDNEIFLDHIGHFVSDAERARDALIKAGFRPTPISIQRNEDENGVKQLTGTGNVTAMLKAGYIEILFKTADTDLGKEFDAAMARYPGLHLCAFAVADARTQSLALENSGLRLRPIVELRRPVATETGEAEAAFTVARVERGEMPEGRIQFLTHHSEQAVWQKRWLDHPNSVDALTDVVIAVENIAEAASRYARFLGSDPKAIALGKLFSLDRGGVLLMEKASFEALFGEAPQLPFIAAYALSVASLEICENILKTNGLAPIRKSNTLMCRFPKDLGVGYWLFAESENDLPWRGT